MKCRLLLLVICWSFNAFAYDSVELMVCDAYKDSVKQHNCYKEFNITIINTISVDDEELEDVFNILQKAFVGTNSKIAIKQKLDKAMKLYKTPLNITNYHKCASVLVAMRKSSGRRFSEMDLLQYMIDMHTSEANLNFPSGAAFASVLME